MKRILSFENFVNEGIDFDYGTKIVSYNPSHEDNIDTSVESNPTYTEDIVGGVRVWSIFKRKNNSRGDGNPLLYALKGEDEWTFRDKSDQDAIERQFDKIATKFVREYPVGVTIFVPSTNELNNHIADVVMSKSKDAELIEGVICKMTTEEVDDIVLRFGSKFREYYKNKFESAYKKLSTYLEIMERDKKGTFIRHFIKDPEMRDVLDVTLKTSGDRFAEFAKKINGQNVLIIDDTISRGQSIKEACKIIHDSYDPQSITVLTLLSPLYDAYGKKLKY